MNNFITQIRNSNLVARMTSRANIRVAARVVVPFNFDDPQQVAAYDAAKSRCARQSDGAFVWRADFAKGRAMFGFTHIADALLFALSMPSASVRSGENAP